MGLDKLFERMSDKQMADFIVQIMRTPQLFVRHDNILGKAVAELHKRVNCS